MFVRQMIVGLLICTLMVNILIPVGLGAELSTDGGSRVAAGSSTLTAHAPISILNNLALSTIASSEHWAGMGTAADPYIIENLAIAPVTGIGTGIQISTTLPLVIRNCTIYGFSNGWMGYGIGLYSSSNVILENNTCLANMVCGILVNGCSDILIMNNNCSQNTERGIRVSYSSRIAVENNSCYGNGIAGIGVESNAVYLDIVNNSCHLNEHTGIELVNTENSRILDNQIEGYPEDSSGMWRLGLQVHHSTNVLVRGNVINCSSQHAIALGDINQFDIMDNTLDGAVWISDAFGGLLIKNTIHDGVLNLNNANDIRVERTIMNGPGMELIGSSNLVVENNTLSGQGKILIVATNCEFNNNSMVDGSFEFERFPTPEDVATHEITTSNTINGHPVYYYKNCSMGNTSVPLDAGQIIMAGVSDLRVTDLHLDHGSNGVSAWNCTSIAIENCTMSGMSTAVQLGKVVGSTIANVTVLESETGFELLTGSTNNRLVDNEVRAGGMGVYGLYCPDNLIERNHFFNLLNAAIYLSDASSCTISRNTLIGGDIGMTIYNGGGTRVQNNTIVGFGAGMVLYNSAGASFDDNVLEGCSFMINGNQPSAYTGLEINQSNTVNGLPVIYLRNADMGNAAVLNDAGQLILGNVSNVKIIEQRLENGTVGVILGYCSNVTIENCMIADQHGFGVHSFISNGTKIINSTIRNADYGVYLIFSSNLWIANNSFQDMHINGIFLDYSSNNAQIENNLIVGGARGGIMVSRSIFERIEGNALYNTSIEMQYLGFLGYPPGTPDAFASNEMSGNTVNGRPLYFLVGTDMGGASLPLDAGQIILVNVTNGRVSGLDLSNQTTGLQCYFSNVTVDNCTFFNDQICGLSMGACGSSTIRDNLFKDNPHSACMVDTCPNALFHSNSFLNNAGAGSAFSLQHNQVQVHDGGHWNTSQGGNFWSDLCAPDANGDGFVDIPYQLNSGEADQLPLVEQPHSPVVASTPIAPTIPSAPTNLVIFNGDGFCSLTWSATPGALSYRVYRGDAENSLTFLVEVIDAHYNDSTVSNGKIYHYVVSAVGTGGEGALSVSVSGSPQAAVVQPNQNGGDLLIPAVASMAVIVGVIGCILVLRRRR
jgi:parallel beta-helix repeat protein